MPLALAVAAGIAADRFATPWGTAVWVTIAFGLGTLALGTARRRVVGAVAILGAWAAVAGAWHHANWNDLAGDDLARGVGEAPRPVWVRGIVRDGLGFRKGRAADDAGGTRAVVDVTAVRVSGGWRNASGRALVSVKGDRTDLKTGDAVEAAGSLSLVPGPLNPGEFDSQSHLKAQGVRLRLAVDDAEGVWAAAGPPPGAGGPARLIRRGLGAVRAWSKARLEAGLDPRVAPLASALVLGRREGVDPDVNDAFARTGTTHLLAISGLHLQVLALALGGALLLAGVGRKSTYATVLVATVVYAAVVGLMPSVVRSAAMTVTYCAAALWDRKGGRANVLAAAALVTLGLNPADLFDVGCQLSFLAVAAIVWGAVPAAAWVVRGRALDPLAALEREFEPGWKGRVRRAKNAAVTGLVVSAVVWLAALPLVALRFHLVSPIGVLLNLPLIPLTSAALLFSGASLGLAAVWGPLGWPFARAGGLLLGWTEDVVRWGAACRWGHAFVPEPSRAWVFGFYAVLGVAAASMAGGWRWPGRKMAATLTVGWAAAGLGLAVAPAVTARRDDPPRAEVLAVGHGLAVVIETGGGRAVLYDCGRMRDPSVGRRVVAPALWARGVSRLDAVVLSHADADHYDGLPDLLDRVAVAAVLVPPGFAGPSNPGAARLLALVRSRGVAVRTVAAGATWATGGTRFLVRHPGAGMDPSASDNARSVVLDVSWRGRHALLTGDLVGPGLSAVVAQPAGGPVDVVLAPHHGGRTANPGWFYDWARPALVVVSQRPPPPGPRDPLRALSVPVLRTWQTGAVRLTWAEGGITARGFLDRDEPTAVVGDGGDRERGTGTKTGRHPPTRARPDRPRPESPPRSTASGLDIMGGLLRWAVAAGGFALGAAVAAGMAVVDWAAWVLVLPDRRPGSVGDLPDGRLGEPIEATAADGVRLAGVWHPAGGGNRHGRVVLVIHGFAEDPSALLTRMGALNRHGWDVAAPDTRAYGRSGGDRGSFGGREAADVSAWIDALSASGRLNGGAPGVAVWGRSMGSAIAARAAADDPRIAALVLEAPYLDLEATLGGILRRRRIPLPRLLARRILRRAHALAGVSLSTPRPIDLAPRIHAPALVLHGGNDAIIPAADALTLARAFPCPAPFIEVPGAGHNAVVDIGGPDLLERVALFLDDAVPEAEDPPAARRKFTQGG